MLTWVCQSQSIDTVKLKLDITYYKGLTSLYKDANLQNIGANQGILVIAMEDILVMDLRNGEVVKTMSKEDLSRAIQSCIEKSYPKDSIKLYHKTQDAVKLGNTRQRYIISQIVEFEKGKLYAAEVSTAAIARNELGFKMVEFIIFLDRDLKIKNVFPMEYDESDSTVQQMFNKGAWFSGREHLYIAKFNNKTDKSGLYNAYDLVDGKYVRNGNSALVPKPTMECGGSGSFFTRVIYRDTSYFNNGQKMVMTDETLKVLRKVDYPIQKNQLIAELFFTPSAKVVFSTFYMQEKWGLYVNHFTKISVADDLTFKNKRTLFDMDARRHAYCSLNVVDHEVHALVFDRQQGCYYLWKTKVDAKNTK